MKKKLAILVTGITMLTSVMPAFAKVDRVTVDTWEITAPNPVVFDCGGGTYHHTLDNVSNNLIAGTFIGAGSYDPNNSYTWDIDGTVNDDDVTFTLVYTGSNLGYTLHGDGAIASDGSISGDTDGNCQTFSMEAGTAVKTTIFDGNHGQWVKMSEDKKAAAKSRVGMPAKSKGHLKD